MSVLDPRFPGVDLHLQRVRGRLNRRLLAGEALVGWAAAAPVLAVAVLLVPLPPLWPRPLVWALGTLAAALVWTGIGFRHRLSRDQAAQWLDEAGGTKGLYRAASEALGRQEFQFPDQVILGQADRHGSGGSPVRYPGRRLALRLALGMLAAAAGTGLLALPVPEGFRAALSEETSPAENQDGRTDGPEAAEGLPPVLSPRDAARRLFPEDQRLAALAEQALASGDAGALESLLEQNPARPDQADRSAGAPSRRPGNQGEAREGTPGEGSGEPGDQGAGTGGTGPSDGKTAQPSAPRKGPQEARPPGPGEGSGEGQESPGGRSDASGAGPGQQLGSGGSGAPGTGHSDQKLGPRAPLGPNDRRVVVPEKTPGGVFEYVLPETGARIPLSSVLADSQKAAEAALDRRSSPLEYENTVRDYFFSLSQETKP